jgi:hypothetical protein
MCFSLNLPDDQLADMAVAGMLPAVREKLFGMDFWVNCPKSCY